MLESLSPGAVLTRAGTGTGAIAPTWRERLLVPVLVLVGMVVSVVSTLGAPLIPTIARVDGVSLATAQWALTAALLSGAVFTPVLGRLGDGPHRRQVVLLVLAVVLAGCVLAALPLGFPALLAGRALQGVGLGVTPLAFAAARDQLAPEKARSAIALLSVSAVAGIGLGYPLNGFVTEGLGLRAGFWFGAGVTSVTLLLAIFVFPSSADRRPRRFDAVGAVLLGSSFTILLLALGRGVSWGWSSPRFVGLTLVALALLAWWVRIELRVADPLVNLRLVRHRVVLSADATGLLAGCGLYLLLALVTRFVQTPTSAGYGFSASVVMAGLVLLPFSVFSILSSRVAIWLAHRTSPEVVLPLGCLVFLGAMLSFLLARGSLWQVFVTMGLAGLGVGCTFAGMPALIVRSVPMRETGSATGFNQVLRILGYSLGSALCATVLEAHTAAGEALPDDGGYTSAAVVGCAVWICAILVSFLVPRRGMAARATADEGLLAQQSVAGGVAGAPLFDDTD